MIRLGTISPKKPNSAVRQLAKVKLKTGYNVRAVIPGSGFDIQVFATVWLHAKRARDMPGVHYRLIRGKGDLQPPDKFQRHNRRSIFSVPNWTYLVHEPVTKRVLFVADKRRHVRNEYEAEANLPLTSTRNRYYLHRALIAHGQPRFRPKKKKVRLTGQEFRRERRRKANWMILAKERFGL